MTEQGGENIFEEKEKVVAISGEDCKNVRDFFTHFKIDLPPDLEDAMKAFEADKTYANQERVKTFLCKAMIESNHPLFKDELFAQVIDNSSKIVWEAQFAQSLETTLTEPKK